MDKNSFLFLAAAMALTSCGGSGSDEPNVPTPEPSKPSSSSPEVKIASRATDASFENADAIGVFMAYGGTFQNTGNYLNNAKYTNSDGVWGSATAYYWRDQTSTADFYGYYPYASSISDATNYSFSVSDNQSVEANYKASDFLWGTAKGKSPSTSTVSLTLDHLMSKIVINVVAGDGFQESDLTTNGVNIVLHNAKNQSQINLGTGSVTATGNTVDITPCRKTDLSAILLLPPQTISGDIIEVIYNNDSYKLNKSFTCESGKQYTATITLIKTQGGINVSIGSWDVVDGDFGGVVN
jgi:phosphotransferase system IIB component